MKNYLLIVILSLLSNTLIAENILFKTKQSISIFDIKTGHSKIIIELTDEDKYYSIGVPIIKNDSLLFLLYNNLDYAGLNFKKKIHEKEYLLKNGFCTLFRNNIVEPFENGFLIKSEEINGAKSERKLEQVNDRYFIGHNPQFVNPYKSIDGDICTEYNGEHVCVLKSTSHKSKNTYIKCGYYGSDLSPDGNYLICYHRCSQFNKKNVGDVTLIELNLQTRKTRELNIAGVCPRYSPKGEYILVKCSDEYLLIDRLNDYKLIRLSGVIDAHWIP